MERRIIISFLTIALIGLVTISCDNSLSSLSEENPPELPSTNSMDMDFSAFGSEETESYGIYGQGDLQESSSHFMNSAIRAIFMKAAVDIHLIIPRALLEAARDAEPEFDDNEWSWSYSRSINGKLKQARLEAARGNGDQIHWSMNVTNTVEGIDNRLLFEGFVRESGLQGEWTYYHLSGEHEPASRLDWALSDEGHADLRLEVLTDRHDRQGDILDYQFDGTIKRVIYFRASDETQTILEWHVETREGFLIAPGYNDGEAACWDANLKNSDCS